MQGSERQAEGPNRTFQTLEQVGRRQCLQALLTVDLSKLAFPCNLSIIHLFVLLEPTEQDVADWDVSSELE